MFRHLSSTWKWVIISTTTLLLLTGLSITLFSPVVNHLGIAHADTNCDGYGVKYAGSSWLTSIGGGVNICNHGGGKHYCLAVSNAPGDTNCPKGYVWTGDEWQCVELVNRLYLTKGWTTATWKGNGGGSNSISNSGNLPAGLIAQSNGSISYVNPGDVISLDYTKDPDGHAGIINSIDSNGTLHIKNQNADLDSSAYIDSGSLSKGNAHYRMKGWSGYKVRAIVHHPGGSTPIAISRSSTSMDVFYTDGRNLVNYGWNSTSGWASHSWADADGTVGQPAAVSRTSDTMDVFYTTGSHKLVHKGWWASTGWIYNDTLITSDVAGSPTAIARDYNDIQVFYRTFAGEIKSISWHGSTWNTNPQNLYTSGATTDPYAVTRSSDSMEVFFGKNNGNIVHLGWSSEYGWVTQDWSTNSTQSLPSKPTAIAYNSGGNMATYFQENGGNVGGESWNWQTGWSGQYWTAQLVGSPSATAGVHNVIDDFYRETGGNIVDRYFTGTGWYTTNIVGSGGATSDPFAITRGTTSQEVFYWNGSKLMDANWNTTSHSWSTAQIN